LSFTDEQLMQNLTAALDAIVRAKPTGAKGQYVKSVVLCSTMSPSVRLDLQSALALKVA
ncbi:MAG TPA: 50S ribosomal protein L1, partial [Ktedonobacterales bacterium]